MLIFVHLSLLFGEHGLNVLILSSKGLLSILTIFAFQKSISNTYAVDYLAK